MDKVSCHHCAASPLCRNSPTTSPVLPPRQRGADPTFRSRSTRKIIYDTASASFHPARKIAARLAEAQAIFVGEVHDDARHHAVQFQIARALQRRAQELSTEGGVAIGCEYFYRSQQPILDAFVAGTPATHDLNWLRAATNWDRTWGWDFRTYAMLFGWAQARGVRLVGLNAPEPVVRIVRERQYEQDPTLLKVCPTRRVRVITPRASRARPRSPPVSPPPPHLPRRRRRRREPRAERCRGRLALSRARSPLLPPMTILEPFS